MAAAGSCGSQVVLAYGHRHAGKRSGKGIRAVSNQFQSIPIKKIKPRDARDTNRKGRTPRTVLGELRAGINDSQRLSNKTSSKHFSVAAGRRFFSMSDHEKSTVDRLGGLHPEFDGLRDASLHLVQRADQFADEGRKGGGLGVAVRRTGFRGLA